jgi:GNAT superfamily N-acetyltransferase
MKETISICQVNPLDAEALSRIALAAKRHWGYPDRWMELWTPQLTFDSTYFETNESWAAESNDRPVAFYTLLDRDGIAWLENLWVLPEWIGKGIGSSLFLHALELARLRGYGILRLEADPHAAGFYEKMGMHKIAERKYDLDGQPRILPIMEKNLKNKTC